MNKGCLIGGVIVAAIIGLLLLVGFGSYNSLVSSEESVKKAWANVEADYQRRYDLIGNLVATVDNAAKFERGTLTDVINARANAQSIKLNVDDLSEANIKKFQEAQDALNQSFLGRMNFLTENYPQLTATQQFRDLSAQIEGTENRINVSRTRYNEEVQSFNTQVRSFPTVIFANLLGFKEKGSFTAVAGADKAVDVRKEFDK